MLLLSTWESIEIAERRYRNKEKYVERLPRIERPFHSMDSEKTVSRYPQFHFSKHIVNLGFRLLIGKAEDVCDRSPRHEKITRAQSLLPIGR